jgi:glyoxylase-like metal-dependent hydrolase (beta-lactamase superfamily II)
VRNRKPPGIFEFGASLFVAIAAGTDTPGIGSTQRWRFLMASELTRRALGKAALAAPVLIWGARTASAAEGADTLVHRFDQKQPFPVNAYIVEGQEGVVIVDGTLTVASSTELRRRADAIGKPVKAVLLTHPHPDHYAGLAAVTAGLDIPIVAQAGVDDIVRRDDALKVSFLGHMFGDAWPKQRVFPNHRIADGAKLDFGPGLVFQAIDIGPAESFHDSLFVLAGDRPVAFVGDLAYDLMHPYMADGQNDAWRNAIARLQTELPEDMILFVGHGAPITKALFSWQRVYLDKFEAAIRAADWTNPAKAADAVTHEMKVYLPTDDLWFLTQLSIEPTARKLGVLG